MKVIVDNTLSVIEFGRRIPRPDSIRYYYQVVGYDCLVMVVHDESYVEADGKQRVALFNFDTVRGDIICDLFPKAPASWRDHEDLIQVTVRRVRRPPSGRSVTLSQAVRHMIGDEC